MRVWLLTFSVLAACGGGGGSSTPDATAVDAEPDLCGNGVVDPGEGCDDGDDDAFDSCVDCAVAACGDGFVRAAVETCDDDTAACVGCRTCEGVGDPATGHCYTMNETLATRVNAQASCAAIGSHLAAIDSAAEWTAIAPLWTTPFNPAWLGLRRAVDGQNMWIWEPGNMLGTPTWNTGEPNDAGGVEDCVEATGATGVWNDLACTQTRRSLCERPTWTIDPATGHAYRVFYGLKTHPEAIADCGSMNTHLATITSAEEQAFVHTVTPLGVWIGAFQAQTENQWYWPNTEPFEFDAWATGQPDDFNAAEDCAQLIAVTGEWNDLACTTRIPYLCEAD